MRAELKVSERRACAVLRQHRSTQRKTPRGRADEAALTADITALAATYGISVAGTMLVGGVMAFFVVWQIWEWKTT